MSRPIHRRPHHRTGAPGAARVLAGLLASGGMACSLAGGTLALEGREGRVIEREAGSPVGSAQVYQAHWRKGRVGEPRSVVHLRWTRSDARGRFRFAAAEVHVDHDSDAPAEYGFYHEDFGLVRAGPAPARPEPLVLSGPRLDEAGRRASRLALCGSRPPDRIVAELARARCGSPEDPQE